eukprot:GILI01011839.1.p1 GENE.GILI01011839.1~~GILI01011839.1.p1  ORF type:complete len:477 (+),score=63.57 GILI01011839.1:30-1460(+)
MKNINRLHSDPAPVPEGVIPNSKMVPQSPALEDITDQSLGVELTAKRLNVLEALRAKGYSPTVANKRPKVQGIVAQTLNSGSAVDIMAASERVLGIGGDDDYDMPSKGKRGAGVGPLLNDPVFAAAVEKSRQVERELAARAALLSHSETDDEDIDDDDSNGTESACSSAKIDPKFLRTYAESCPLPWNTFLRLRKSWGQPIKLTEAQEENIFRAIEKIPQGVGSIHDSLPFVTAFLEKHCPELKSSKVVTEPRHGTTLLLLSVITGNAKLCYECLKLGANPNNCSFLTDLDAPDNRLRHGYSPMFMACICEQVEIMTMLRQHGGSIHVTDRWGRTPLHAAAAMGSKEVLTWLVAEGAPRKVVDIDLQKPGEVCEGKVIPALTTTSSLFRPVDQPVTCHCNNKKFSGKCGCIDDMTDAWYKDRLTSIWSKTFQAVRDDLNMLSLGTPTAAQVMAQAQAKQQQQRLAQQQQLQQQAPT